MVTAICTTPLDVLKTRLMTQGAKKTYTGPFDCLGRILKEEGASALFKVGRGAVSSDCSCYQAAPGHSL